MQMPNDFQTHLRAIPHITEESDAETYLRAFARMTVDEDVDEEYVLAAAQDAIRFVSHDAFRRGFEACHENCVVPQQQKSVSREAAIMALRQYGARVRQGIAAHFEDGPGIPTRISFEIDNMTLPPTKGLLP
ncbi:MULTISPECIES: hypothetical protein [unclassified Rhizobium]|uniref:hypothetical protein n=1 Tax=unclassified Rhizobium TaxID=2613769 RepID=UPI0006F90D01|nr:MULTISPECIES: hypothetical protein [unclassified Rhizobium]KQV33127.1 hypothetical protein ASC86_18375 [Rhizobium sp. Root1212]KRD21587.1 hypothetical protein ASE37_18875 [Rhizobium sp. Root268]